MYHIYFEGVNPQAFEKGRQRPVIDTNIALLTRSIFATLLNMEQLAF
jgi:hypothetical protein